MRPSRDSLLRGGGRAPALQALLFAALLLLATRPLFPLDPDRALTQFGLDVWQRRQGLPQSSATAIVPARDGYLWVGTEEGLARFDGVRFSVFDRKNTPELERHNVTTLLESRDGSLWIGASGRSSVGLRGREGRRDRHRRCR